MDRETERLEVDLRPSTARPGAWRPVWPLLGVLAGALAGGGLLWLSSSHWLPVAEPASTSVVNPVFEAVTQRDADALAQASDGLDPAWLDAVVNGMTPVMVAVSNGDVPVLEMLLRLGADPHGRGMARRTALQYAAERNHIDAARVLLAAGVDVDGADTSGLTPLIMAADRGFNGFAELMLDNGADVNASMSVGWTALLDAARHGNVDLCVLLLDRGADVHATINGNTAADLARRNGHTEVVGVLEDAVR